jgi:hypothetical protein
MKKVPVWYVHCVAEGGMGRMTGILQARRPALFGNTGFRIMEPIGSGVISEAAERSRFACYAPGP